MFSPPNALVRLACGVAIGLAVGILVSVMLAKSGACARTEEFGVCAREWTSALSGWAAAFGALLTLRPLWRQLAEMRRQTNYLLGDEMPVLQFLQADSRFESGQFRIVNWNRRPLILTEMHFYADDIPVDVYNIGGFKEDFRLVEYRVVPKLRIPGYESRSGDPPSTKLQFSEMWDFSSNRRRPGGIARIVVNGYLDTSPPRPVTLEVSELLED